MNREYTAGMWVFGMIIDRYATDGYGEPVGTTAVLDMGKQAGVVGLDLNFPFPEPDLTSDDIASAMKTRGLATVCITPAIYTRRFARGSFTNPDRATRQAAVDLAESAVSLAGALGAKYVKFWPGQDGYDYPFQCDYREYRQRAVDGIGTVARNHPEMQFGIEYKLKEPRNRLFWSSAPRTILELERARLDNVGVVIDFGHSIFAKENPSEMLTLVHETGRLVDVELCDNYGEWDDDLTPGVVHALETLEFLLTLREIGWSEPLKLDLFPYRENPVEAVRTSIETLRRMEDVLDRLDTEALRASRARHDSLSAQRAVFESMWG